jgi:hypothetical protein
LFFWVGEGIEGLPPDIGPQVRGKAPGEMLVQVPSQVFAGDAAAQIDVIKIVQGSEMLVYKGGQLR